MTDLPSTWALTPLENLIAHDGVFTDGDWVESKDQDPNGSVRLIQLADIADNRFVNKSSRFLTLDKAFELNCTFLKRGDILVARMPDPLGRSCLFPLEGDQSFVTVVDVCVIRLGSVAIEPRYLMRAINSPTVRGRISDLQSGSTRKRISRGNLATVPIPIAPTNEQRRIVERIEAMFDEIDKGVESLQTARSTLGLYRQSLLKSAFEGRLTADWRARNADKLEAPDTLLERAEYERDKWHRTVFEEWSEVVEGWKADGSKGPKPRRPDVYKQSDPLTAEELGLLPEIPEEWIFLRLNDIAAIGSGMSVSKSRKLDDPVEVPYLRVANVQRGFLDLDEIKTMEIERSQADALGLATWDVLFNEGGDRDKLGRGWVWENQVPNCITQNHVFRASPFRHDLTWSQFISHWGNSFGRDYFEKGGKQTTNLASINKTVLKALPVPYCSPAEQIEVVRRLDARLEAATRLEAEIDAALARADAMRQSILKQAFSGKLVPQDPGDEPASTLLARIKAEKAEREQAAKRDRKSAPTRKPQARRPTLTDLIEVLEKQKSSISAAKAAQALGVGDGSTSDDVEEFYRQLKDSVEDGAIDVERRGDEDWLRLAKAEVS